MPELHKIQILEPRVLITKEEMWVGFATGMAYYRPVENAREIPVKPSETALLFIDVQNFNCNVQGALHANMSPQQLQVGP